MIRYTANVAVPDRYDLEAFMITAMLEHAGYDVEQVPDAGLIVQGQATDDDEFLDALEDELAPFVDATIVEWGEAV